MRIFARILVVWARSVGETVAADQKEGWRYVTHTAAHCKIMQHTATYCDTLQHTAIHCNTVTADEKEVYRCVTLQHTAAHCNTLQRTAAH